MKKIIILTLTFIYSNICFSQINVNTINSNINIRLVKESLTPANYKVYLYNNLDSTVIIGSKFDYLNDKITMLDPEYSYLKIIVTNKATSTQETNCYPLDVYPSNKLYSIQTKTVRMFQANDIFISDLNKVNLADYNVEIFACLTVLYLNQVFNSLEVTIPVEFIP